MKIYAKAGRHNYKEAKLVKALQEYFKNNPVKAEGFAPATTPEQLKEYHDHYCIEETPIISETKTKSVLDVPEVPEEDMLPISNDVGYEPADDPMNRDEPKIRDYVLDDGFKDENSETTKPSAYDEPQSFKDSFGLPNESIQSESKPKQQQPLGAPLNSQPKEKSSGPDPDAKIKRKSKKKFTKYAVDAVCALAERGIVWYGTKDITEERLAKYIADDEIVADALDILVHIDSATQGTVRQFFQSRIETIKEFAKFTVEEKEDLGEALEDFLEYKKIEINPTINIGVIFLGMIFERALNMITIRAETNSILVQLRDRRGQEEETANDAEYIPPPVPDHKPSIISEEENETVK